MEYLIVVLQSFDQHGSHFERRLTMLSPRCLESAGVKDRPMRPPCPAFKVKMKRHFLNRPRSPSANPTNRISLTRLGTGRAGRSGRGFASFF